MPTLNERQDLAKKSDLLTKQDTLIPGTGISIAADGKTISATGTGGSTVTVTPVLSTGTRVAAMEVDGTIYTLFAPTPPSVGVTQVVDQGVELARVTINGVATSIYAPESSTVLSGTSAPSSSLGENNNLYVQYTVENENYTVDMTYVKLNGEWVQLSAGGGGVTIPEHWSWTTDNLKAYLLAAPNEYGWAVGINTYYFDTAKTWTIYNREFSRGDNGPVLLAGIYHDNRWFGTAAISTNQEATYFSYNEQGFGPYSYKGYDWYISGGNYSMEYGNYNGIAYYGAVTGGGFNSDEQRLNIIKAIVDASDLNPLSDDFTAIVRDDANIMFAAGGEEDDYSDATFKVMRDGTIDAHEYLIDGSPLSAGNVDDVYVNGASVLDSDKIAQITSYKEVTQAEYDALPASKLTDNVLYCIKDKATADTTVAPIIYSEEEREVGVWTDGKPLYQKTFVLTGTYSGSMTIGNINVSNIDTLIISECTGHTADGTWRNISFAHMDASNNSGLFIKTNGDVEIRCGSGVSGQYAYDKIQFNIRYTKTTDTPGSGKYAPSGVPAVHYSEEEQVVGTWIDGQTIYQKTFQFTNLSSSTSTWVNLISFPGVDNMLSMAGHVTLLNDGQKQQISLNGLYVQTTYLNNYLKYYCQNISGNLNIFLTIQYTKTTS